MAGQSTQGAGKSAGGKDLNQSLASRASGATAATGKGTAKAGATVSESEPARDDIDYKNEAFQEVVEEISAAREKIKLKFLERSPDDAKSNRSGARRRTTVRRSTIAGATGQLF